jgi:hypothetical protein
MLPRLSALKPKISWAFVPFMRFMLELKPRGYVVNICCLKHFECLYILSTCCLFR